MKATYIKPQTNVYKVKIQTMMQSVSQVSFTDDTVDTEDAYSSMRIWDNDLMDE